MKKLFLLGLGVMLLSVANQCKAEDITVNRNVPAFSGVKVSQGIRANINMGDSTIVKVTAPDAEIGNVITEVKNGMLIIHFNKQVKFKYVRDVVVDITTPKLDKLVATSGSTVVATDVKSNSFFMSSTSGSQLTIGIEATSITAESKSGASMSISGKTQKVECSASSGASLHAKDLVSSVAKAEVSSGASLSVTAESSLAAAASSGGSISYYGNATVTDVRASSGGSIRHK